MENTNVVINELKLLENFNILFDNKVVLYGAGYCGTKTHNMLKATGVPVSYFCDGNMQKCGTFIDGIEVLSPQELKQIDDLDKLVIIITTDQVHLVDQIMNLIVGLKLRTKNIFTIFGLNVSLVQNTYDPRINENMRILLLHEDRVTKLRRLVEMSMGDILKLIHVTKAFLKNSTTVLVYQPGKVGSLTIAGSLSAIGISNNHVHRLNIDTKEYNDENIIKYVHECRNVLSTSHRSVKIITLVREPVSQYLSLCFQIMDGIGINIVISPGDSLMNTFVKIANEKTVYNQQFEWFDLELKDVFGIDIYDHPFDRKKGYSIIKKNNIEVLVMKLEKLNELEEVIGEFVCAPHFKLVNSNENDNKLYKYLYKNVKETIKLPREFYTHYYEGNHYMDHFYTPEEKAEFWKKWEKNIE